MKKMTRVLFVVTTLLGLQLLAEEPVFSGKIREKFLNAFEAHDADMDGATGSGNGGDGRAADFVQAARVVFDTCRFSAKIAKDRSDTTEVQETADQVNDDFARIRVRLVPNKLCPDNRPDCSSGFVPALPVISRNLIVFDEQMWEDADPSARTHIAVQAYLKAMEVPQGIGISGLEEVSLGAERSGDAMILHKTCVP